MHGLDKESVAMNGSAIRLICAVLLCMSGYAYGEEFSAKVIEVLDGDTVMVVRTGGLLKIRLAEIDAPEKAQSFGAASMQSLSGLVKGKQVKFISQTMDQYGRMVAHLSLDGLDVNAEQIRRGMAWEYSNFHGNKTLVALQHEAMEAPRGLWAQSDPTPPWQWRKLHPNTLIQGADNPSTTDFQANAGTNCGKRKYCSDMVSCEEAKYYLTQCGVRSLDSDGDGVPCENLCLPKK
jgi:endonuclease YncB( thermonuclease family)